MHFSRKKVCSLSGKQIHTHKWKSYPENIQNIRNHQKSKSGNPRKMQNK